MINIMRYRSLLASSYTKKDIEDHKSSSETSIEIQPLNTSDKDKNELFTLSSMFLNMILYINMKLKGIEWSSVFCNKFVLISVTFFTLGSLIKLGI